ncbi:MAG: hypothetical protein KG028_08190 [Actinobacteria bacterium]|jgi:hypothetical protein|nr:hypothetical protein [Actinomycetota bacterium]
MRTRTLALLLTGCALFAAWPVFMWAFARLGWIDERFVATLGSTAFSLPVGLAAAALALVAHGLRVNGELYDLLELDEVDEDEQIARGRAAAAAAMAAPAGSPAAAAAAGPNVVTVSGGTAVATAAPPTTAEAAEEPSKYGNKMAVAERKNQGFKDKDGQKPKKAKRARRTAKSMANRGKYAAKNAAARKVRDGFRMPRF